MSVLDASVTLKWLVQEEHSNNARKIQDDYIAGKIEIIVPDLLLYEVANALRFNPTFNQEETLRALNYLSQTGINVIPVSFELIQSAVKLAFALDLTVYDAIYVSLAAEFDTDFITADKKLFKKTQKLSQSKWLGNI